MMQVFKEQEGGSIDKLERWRCVMVEVRKGVMDAMNETHAGLLHDLRALLDCVKAGRLDRTLITYRLVTVRDRLAHHFELEEQNGYMETVLEREPEFSRSIYSLQAEHQQLLKCLDELILVAQTGSGTDAELAQSAVGWERRVREHERRENLLLQDAFNLDLAGED
jgi:hypothetical protein